jgi:(1->4)-alpha-D-glucan 1-alpha-D-glucosylmutase
MAKGLEDTAFYIYNRLVSLNEVGDEPHRFGVAVDAFHAANRLRAERWPHAMLNTSTHDSKRSEDVRARIDVLSEMVPAWEQAVDRWHRLNADRKTRVGGKPAPSRNDEYALYQNLLGIWPLAEVDEAGLERLRGRFIEYTLKAVREAKVHTSWLNRNQAYEDAITAFIEQLLDPADRAFVDDFAAFARTVARFGLFNSLSQLLVKLTAPGIPDTYQGSEIWQFRLVDPDNRRPVDWHDLGERFRSLQELLAGDDPPLAERLGALLDHPADGRVKMYTLWRTLNCRREHEQLFAQGSYLPLRAQGPAADHLFAFARVHRQYTVLVCVPRLVARLQETTGERLALDGERFGETTLPVPDHLAGLRLQNLFCGTGFTVPTKNNPALRAADLFRHFPVALLVADTGPS